jgi:hypothetical protein
MEQATTFFATNRRLIAAWAGMLGSALFVAVFTIEGWLRPGYNPLGVFVSELSMGSRGWIQIANFVVSGALLLVFARGIAAEIKTGKASRAGSIILTTIAICLLASGPFVTDPAGIPREQMSWHGTIHGIFGAIVFVLMPVCCFVFLRRFRVDVTWQSLQWWTLVAGIIIALAVVLLTISTKLSAVVSTFNDYAGLIQRMALIPYMIWSFTFALKLYRLRP